jgi:predicted nucleic acid-binding protein
MIAVVDSSVALKWFLAGHPQEQDTDLALKILEQSVLGFLTFVQPPHFVAEVGAMLMRLKPVDAREDLHDLLSVRFQLVASPEMYVTALKLATRYQHHLYETLYHAVALHTPGATLITANQAYVAQASKEGNITLLSELEHG